MQNLQETYEKIFGEIKSLLSELSKSDSYEEILARENELNQLYQKFSFLKVAQNFDFFPTENEPLQVIDNQITNIDSDLVSVEEFEEENKVAEIIVEETEVHDIFDDVSEVEEVHSFTEIDEKEYSEEIAVEEVSSLLEIETEINNIKEEIESEENVLIEEVSNQTQDVEIVEEISEVETEADAFEENLFEKPSQKLEPMQDSQFSFAMEKEEPVAENPQDDYEARLAEKEANLKELEESRRKIVEFSKENTQAKEKSHEVYESSDSSEHHEKKFKLANIKGLKIAKSLFDDDPLEEIQNPVPAHNSGSLLKNNVPTDYMEAPKPRPEFKLDLNDRIAFSQHLFNGSQIELNQVVAVLNSFTSLEKAQEFLSDIYYEREWKKVDSYAQRLWSLVENRFL